MSAAIPPTRTPELSAEESIYVQAFGFNKPPTFEEDLQRVVYRSAHVAALAVEFMASVREVSS